MADIGDMIPPTKEYVESVVSIYGPKVRDLLLTCIVYKYHRDQFKEASSKLSQVLYEIASLRYEGAVGSHKLSVFKYYKLLFSPLPSTPSSMASVLAAFQERHEKDLMGFELVDGRTNGALLDSWVLRIVLVCAVKWEGVRSNRAFHAILDKVWAGNH